MVSLEELTAQYQEMHDAAALGGVAKPKTDSAGEVAFYNPKLALWEWYIHDEKHGYRQTGSTQSFFT